VIQDTADVASLLSSAVGDDESRASPPVTTRDFRGRVTTVFDVDTVEGRRFRVTIEEMRGGRQ
jgi:hypothetical protein